MLADELVENIFATGSLTVAEALTRYNGALTSLELGASIFDSNGAIALLASSCNVATNMSTLPAA